MLARRNNTRQHEAVFFVESARRIDLQDAQPHGHAGRPRFVFQAFHEVTANPAILVRGQQIKPLQEPLIDRCRDREAE
jgi:hypothetical protein